MDFQGSLCVLRRIFGRDDPSFAFPASMLASVAFKKYPDTTVALYVMWKAAQVTLTPLPKAHHFKWAIADHLQHRDPKGPGAKSARLSRVSLLSEHWNLVPCRLVRAH